MATGGLTLADIHLVREPDEDDIAPSTAADRRPVFSADAVYDRSRILAHHLPSRVPKIPILPDLRFEQAYLNSLRSCNGSWWKIAYMTIRDQVLMMFIQGMFYGFLKCGYGVLKITRGNGRTFGGKIRNWWVRINESRPEPVSINESSRK